MKYRETDQQRGDMDNIASLVKESLEQPLPDLVPRHEVIRELSAPQRFNLVEIITGMRRSGKTFYLFQLMKNLRDSGVPRSRMFYFDFSDDRLFPADPDVLSHVVEEYWRQVPEARDDGCYLLLDEVQEVENWQGSCQRLAEHERVTLIITGSSSKLSSEEIATKFRGRSHSREMLPLSFREFCRFQGHDLPPFDGTAVSGRTRTLLEGMLDRYLVEGGFPGVQGRCKEERTEVLQGYARDVVARDVAERLGREDIRLVNQFALYGLRNTACEFSINQLVEDFRTLGYKLYWEKADRIVDLLEQAYLFFRVPEHSFALRPKTTSVPKAYAIDPGLVHAVSRANQQDAGKRLETAIYLELRRRTAGRRTETITSYTVPGERGRKVDFLLGDALAADPFALIQVTLEMSHAKTRERELESLQDAMRTLGIERGTIITLRDEEVLRTTAGTIDVVPAWKWLCLDERP